MTKLQAAREENDKLTHALINLVLAINEIANNPQSDITHCHKHFEHAVQLLDSLAKRDERLPN